jgi:hypothetical protein
MPMLMRTLMRTLMLLPFSMMMNFWSLMPMWILIPIWMLKTIWRLMLSNTHDKHIQSLHQGHENIGGGCVYHGVMQFLHPDVMTRVLRVLPLNLPGFPT